MCDQNFINDFTSKFYKKEITNLMEIVYEKQQSTENFQKKCTHLKQIDKTYINSDGEFVIPEMRKRDDARPGILLIMADWCGHCTRFKPTYGNVAAAFDSMIPFYYIKDSDLSSDDPKKDAFLKSVRESLNVRGFPTLKYIHHDGTVGKDYEGGREAKAFMENIYQFVKSTCKF